MMLKNDQINKLRGNKAIRQNQQINIINNTKILNIKNS